MQTPTKYKLTSLTQEPDWPPWLDVLVEVSHLALTICSSLNFYIYMLKYRSIRSALSTRNPLASGHFALFAAGRTFNCRNMKCCFSCNYSATKLQSCAQQPVFCRTFHNNLETLLAIIINGNFFFFSFGSGWSRSE